MENISSLTNYEFIKIVSSFYSSTEDKVNCHECLNRYAGRKDYDRMTERKRTIQSCYGISENVIFNTKYLKYRTCIGNIRDNSYPYLYSMYQVYKQGRNPFGGAYIDVPNKFVEMCNLLDNLITDKQIEDARKAAKDGRRSQN